MFYEQINIQGTRHHYISFDSVSDQMEEVEKAIPKMYGYTLLETTRKDFIGRSFPNLKAALKAQTEIWPEGLQILEDMIRKLEDLNITTPQSLRRTQSWSEDSGEELNIPRLRDGLPFWRTTKRQHRPGPINCTIIANLGALSSIPHANILWRGAAMIVLSELIEKVGYRTELWGARRGRNAYTNYDWNAYSVLLKRGYDILDRSTLINAVSGWSYRTAGFGVNFVAGPGVTDGYGFSTYLGEELCKIISKDPIRFTCDGIWSLREAETWIRESIATIK